MTATLPAADLARLVAMEKAATPGEWTDDVDSIGVPDYKAKDVISLHEPSGFGYQGGCSITWRKEDRAFIVALRNAAPSLLAEVGRLRRVEEAARELRDAVAGVQGLRKLTFKDNKASMRITFMECVALDNALKDASAALSPSPEVQP